MAFSLAAGVALLPVGIAHADCTGAGDFGAGAGCASSRFVVRIRQHRELAPDLGGLAAATELRLGQW